MPFGIHLRDFTQTGLRVRCALIGPFIHRHFDAGTNTGLIREGGLQHPASTFSPADKTRAAMTLRIAVLVNTPFTNRDFWADVRTSYSEALCAVAPTAAIHFYDPVYEQKFPDPSRYDLIILSGGKADASSSEPWVLGVLDFIRNSVRDSPRTKILGICWGHQAIARAHGGKVRPVPTGPIVRYPAILNRFL